jgi:hypothetical protein
MNQYACDPAPGPDSQGNVNSFRSLLGLAAVNSRLILSPLRLEEEGTLHLRIVDGKTFTIPVTGATTAEEVKQKAGELINILPAYQLLAFTWQTVVPNVPLTNLHVWNGATALVIFRLAMKSNTPTPIW